MEEINRGADANHCAGSSTLPLHGSICLTEGQCRTLCVSNHLPSCFTAVDDTWGIEQFQVVTELYRGKLSALHEAVHNPSGMRVAIKQYKKRNLSSLAKYQIEREVCIHISLHHPHIIQLFVAFEDPDLVYLVQEFAPGGDLFEALKHQKHMMYDEPEAVGCFMAPFLEALEYMHERGIIHRDIKPENILIGEGGALKLADFGLAINKHQERPVTRAGTLDYMAPEVLVCPDKKRPEENKDSTALGYDEQVDAWAAGCLAAELITGSPPFESESRSATYQLIMYREPRLSARLSDAAKGFIVASLVKDPHERATVQRMLQHEWITMNRSTIQEPKQNTEELQVQQSPGRQHRNSAAMSVAVSINQEVPAIAVDCAASNELLTVADYVASGSEEHTSGTQYAPADLCEAATATGSKAESEPCSGRSNELCRDRQCVMAVANNAGLGSKASTDAGGGFAELATASIGTAASMQKLQTAVVSSAASFTTSEFTSAFVGDNKPEFLGSAGVEFATGASDNQAEPNSSSHRQQVKFAESYCAQASAPPVNMVELVSSMTAADADSEAATVNSAAAAADGLSSSGSRAARATSHHGHRLHKLFYPHDRHRRSSFYNTQWDDLIDTSARSFTSSKAAVAESILGSAGDGLAPGFDRDELGAAGDSRTHVPRLSSVSGSTADQLRGSGVSSFTAAAEEAFSNSAGTSSNGARAGLAALCDASVQAPAAVVSEVLSSAASGALHLLPANDLEDLIAPNLTPSNALNSLGFVALHDVSLASRGCSVTGAVSSNGCSRPQSISGTGFEHAGSNSAAQTQSAAAELTALSSANLDDYIAPSASPSISRGNQVSILVSRIKSAPDLSFLVGASHSSAMALGAGSRASNTPPDAVYGNGTCQRARGAPATGHFSCDTPQGGSGSPAPCSCLHAVDTAAAAADRHCSIGKPVIRAKSGTALSLLIPDDDGDAHQGTSPKKSVVWADAATLEATTPSSFIPGGAVPADSLPTAPSLLHARSSGAMCTASSSMPSSPTPCSPSQAANQKTYDNDFASRSSATAVHSVSQLATCPATSKHSEQQQQRQPERLSSPTAAPNFYVPPSGVLSSDAWLARPTKPPLASKGALAGTPRKAVSAIGSAAVDSSIQRCTLDRQHASCTGWTTNTAAASSLNASAIKSAVPCGAVKNTLSTPAALHPASEGISQDVCGGGICTSPHGNADAGLISLSKPYRRCKWSSDGADFAPPHISDAFASRQQTRPFTTSTEQAGDIGRTGTAATAHEGCQDAAVSRSSCDAGLALSELMVARRQAKSFTGVFGTSASSFASDGGQRRHGALTPTRR